MNSQRLRSIGILAVTALALLVAPGGAAADTFAPTISMQTSTSRATAHPDARITIDNSASSQNIKDLTLSLPDGFWGSLGAVTAKCSENDATDGTCGANTPESKIGTVTATAKITDPDTGTVANGVLTGDVFMTEALGGNRDPAGLSIVVQAKVGNVDLGKVKITGRAVARMVLPAGFPSNAVKDMKGLDAIIKGIPEEIHDTVHNRIVSYKVEKMQVDLISHQQDPSDPNFDWTQPLLTNPSRCGTYEISAVATPYGVGADATFSDDYEVDHCKTARFDPTVDVAFSNSTLAPSSVQGVTTFVTFANSALGGTLDTTKYHQPETNSSFSSLKLVMPRGFGANYDAFANSSNQCPGSTLGIVGDRYLFKDPQSCPSQAKVGTVFLVSPLAPDNLLTGNIYLINNTPLPALAIAVTDNIAGNVPGINIYLVGTANLENTDTLSSGDSRVIMTFKDLPDTPVSFMYVDLDQGPRSGGASSKLLKMTDDGTANCQPDADLKMNMGASSGASRAWVQSYHTGCTGAQIEAGSGPGSGPWGQITTDTTPTFDFTSSSSAPELFCGIDTIATGATACKSALSYTPPAPLAEGTHSMIVGDGTSPTFFGSKPLVRDFAVQQPISEDNDAPSTTLTAGPGYDGNPGSTSDTTPSFTFNSDEDSAFQCSIDAGAFLPCGSASGSGDVSWSIPSDEALIPNKDTEHTFAVRAQDTQGNVDLTPASATFKVQVPFNPTMAVDLTTTQARAHPEMTLTIDNPSEESMKDLMMSLPDGFLGGLTGVQSLCSIAAADSGSCGAGSKVGTVTATAVIDRTTVTTTGDVYMTEPRVLGDPAALLIDVTPKLQDVTFNPIRVPARVAIRGVAQGMDTFVVNIPDSATSTVGEVSTFAMRSMKLQLKDNPAAPRPLLTNPSYCGPMAFSASFTGYAASTGSASVPFQATGCNALPFGPAMGMTMVDGATGKPAGPSDNIKRVDLKVGASLTSTPDQAGIKHIEMTMPNPVTIDVQKLPDPCSLAEQAAKACPAAAAIGHATATTPLLAEPLSGTVYLLKANPATPSIVLPRILIALRGRINIDVIGTTSFVNINQIVAKFDTLPDAPISSFALEFGTLLTTRANSCDYGPADWNVTGTLTGFNGSVSSVVIPQKFDCPSASSTTARYKFKRKGGQSAFSATVRAQHGKKLKKLTVKLPSGLKFRKSSFSKKNIARSIKVRADGRTVKTSCLRRMSAKRFQIKFCKRSASRITITFRSGSVIASKNITKKPHFHMIAKDTHGKMKRVDRLGW